MRSFLFLFFFFYTAFSSSFFLFSIFFFMRLLILGFALIVKCWALDPCASISDRKYVSYSEAKACLDYFKFDPIIADQTIYTIQKTIEHLYVFNVKYTNCIYIYLERLYVL